MEDAHGTVSDTPDRYRTIAASLPASDPLKVFGADASQAVPVQAHMRADPGGESGGVALKILRRDWGCIVCLPQPDARKALHVAVFGADDR